MKRKLVLAAALCLAAALSIGAAPALAADGCDCHTAATPSATPAHAPLVAGVSDCTVCHTDWTVPHPDVGPGPAMWLSSGYKQSGYELWGRLGIGGGFFFPWFGHPGVVIYLQQQLWGETAFTDLGQVTTDSGGDYRLPAASPQPFAAYRAVAQGHVGALLAGGTGLFKPKAVTTWRTPKLTLTLRGVRKGVGKLGRSVTAKVTVKPADIGVKVLIRVDKRVHGKWVKRIGVWRALSASGTYAYRFTPRHRGLFRVWFRTPRVDVDDQIMWMHETSSERRYRVR